MRQFMASVAIVSLIGFSGCSQAGASDQQNRANIEKIVKDYLLENPEIVRDALIALQAKEEKASLDLIRDDIFNDDRDIVIGPKDAKITIVEFFDYNCGYCKRSTEWVKETIDTYGDDVRIIFKETPLLDGRAKTSKNAAKAALAAARQDKYSELHFALMEERSLSEDRVLEIAKEAGLNMEKLKADMEDPALERQINDALVLISKIPSFSGTPYFFVNDEYVSGANTPELDRLLKDALKG